MSAKAPTMRALGAYVTGLHRMTARGVNIWASGMVKV